MARPDASGSALWKRPGVWVFVLMLSLAAVGWGLVIREGQRIPVREAELGGLEMHLEEARWILDQMDHGENFQKPSTMMPDMPEWGKQRVTLDLSFQNRSRNPQLYDGREFTLVPELGDPVPPIGAQLGTARLEPGQGLNTALHFDFDTTQPHGKLRVEWRRAGESVFLPIPEPAEHYHLRPRGGEVALPRDAKLVLPLGDADRGRLLYNTTYACVSCHGDPDLPDTHTVGPHLHGIATVAENRQPGRSPAQYLYESILEPNAFIAPECKSGPCQQPSAMPEYASLLTIQHVADLLVYLAEQRSDAVNLPEPATPSG